MKDIEYYKAIKRGDWIFTCKLQPLQFDMFQPEKNPEHYNRESFTDEQWEQFSKYGDFCTLNGSNHSTKNCGLLKVSDAYGEWFNDNQVWLLYEQRGEAFSNYERRVKALCQYFEIEYEGI